MICVGSVGDDDAIFSRTAFCRFVVRNDDSRGWLKFDLAIFFFVYEVEILFYAAFGRIWLDGLLSYDPFMSIFICLSRLDRYLLLVSIRNINL